MADIANRAQIELEVNDLGAFSTLAFHLRSSTLFPRFIRRVKDEESKQSTYKIYDHFRMIGVYTTAKLMFTTFHDKYANAIPHLEIVGENQFILV
jgi:hypothetical protein